MLCVDARAREAPYPSAALQCIFWQFTIVLGFGEAAFVQAAIDTLLASGEADLRHQDARVLPHRCQPDGVLVFLLDGLLPCGRCVGLFHARLDVVLPLGVASTNSSPQITAHLPLPLLLTIVLILTVTN